MVSHSRAQPSARRLLASASISAVPMPAWAGETLAVLSDQRRQCSGVDKFAVYRHCGGTPPLAQEATDPLGVCRLGLADNGALLGHGCGVSRCRAVERRPDGLIAISLGSLPYSDHRAYVGSYHGASTAHGCGHCGAGSNPCTSPETIDCEFPNRQPRDHQIVHTAPARLDPCQAQATRSPSFRWLERQGQARLMPAYPPLLRR